METRVEDVGPCRKKLSITVTAEAVAEAIEKSYSDLRSTVAIPGFRKGRAPRGVLEKRYGAHVIADVKQDLVIQGIQEAVDENELQVVGDPKLDGEKLEFEPGAEFSFSAEVEVRPDIELPDYRGIEVERKVKATTDEEVDGVLDQIRGQKAEWLPVEDGGAAEKDLVIGKLVLRDGDEQVFEREDAHMVVGDDDGILQIPVADLSARFEGATLEQTIEIDGIEVPDSHPVSDLKGRTVSLTFEVAEIKRMELPELDDELAGSFDFDGIDEMRERVRSDLDARHGEAADRQVEEAVIDAILAKTDFPLPETVVEEAIGREIQNRLMQAMMSGQLGKDDIGAAATEMREELRPDVERSIRGWYVLEKIAKKEKVFSTESDFIERIQQMAISSGKTPTQVLEEIEKNEARDQVRTDILEQKVRKWLTDNAKISEVTDDGAERSDEAGE